MGKKKNKNKGEKRKRGGHGHRRGRHYSGQPLWKLLHDLPNHGVGRLIVRGTAKQNEEAPTYMRILEVDYEGRYPHKKKEGKYNLPVKVEKVFRGVIIPKIGDVTSTSYMPDFNLVPIEEEEKLLKYTKTAREMGYVYWTGGQKRNIRNLVNQGIPLAQAKQMEKERIWREEEAAGKRGGFTPNQSARSDPGSSREIMYDNFDDGDDDNDDGNNENGNETDESDDEPNNKQMKMSEANPVP